MKVNLDKLVKQINDEINEAISKNICVSCKKYPRFYSEAGRREYRISGLCEYCFDAVTMEPEDIEVKMNDPKPVDPTELTEKELEDAMMEEDLEPENDDEDDEDKDEDDNDDSA